MPARPAWKGQLRLALVSIPVEIYAAARSTPQIEFRQIHRKSGQRIRYEKVVPGIGPVGPDEIAKGYEIERGEYVLLDERDLDAVKLESRRTLELTHFVERDAIDPLYFERPFFVVPADELAEEAYIVLREALRASGRMGLGQLAMRGREHVVALKPCGRGMMLESLRYADELNKAASYFRDIGEGKPDPELLELATTLIEKKSGRFDAGEFRDRYVDAVKALVEEKRRGHRVKPMEEAPASKRGNVIDLMAALRKSVDSGAGRAKAEPAPAAKPAAKDAKAPTKGAKAAPKARAKAPAAAAPRRKAG